MTAAILAYRGDIATVTAPTAANITGPAADPAFGYIGGIGGISGISGIKTVSTRYTVALGVCVFIENFIEVILHLIVCGSEA
ncbi:MAG: hypothetical protein WBO08_04975 [Mycobacterium sp.]